MKFSSLNTAVSGMNAAQANLYVTGHNMANANNVGYTRQQVVQADHFSQNVGRNHSGLMQVGLGANIQSIRQIRDNFLDLAYRTSASTLGFYSVSYNVGRSVEAAFGELEGEYKLQSVLRDLKNHIAELHNNMTGVETRGEFISSCLSFVNKANSTYEDLVGQQYNLNDNIITMTKRVNELIAEINHYSQLIRINELAGDSANDFRDIVNLALDELSTYLQIDYSIKPGFNISIYSEGTALLVNNHQTLLGFRYCSPDSGLVEIVVTRSTEILNYDDEAPLFFRYNRNIDSMHGNDGGALKGLLVSRGLRSVSYVDTPEQIQARYNNDRAMLDDALAAARIARDDLLTEQAALITERDDLIAERAALLPGDPRIADIDGLLGDTTDPPTGITARLAELTVLIPDTARTIDNVEKDIRLATLQFQRDMFNIRNCIIPQAQMQMDTLINSIVKLINNTLAPVVLKNPNVNDPNHADYDPYHADFNVWVKADGFTVNGVDFDGYPYGQDGSQGYIPIFVRKNESYNWDEDTQSVRGEDPADRASLFTIGNFILNPVLRNQSGYKLMTLSPSGDIDDHRLLADLLKQWDSKFVGIDGQQKMSVEDFYAKMVSNLGVEIQRFKTISESENEVLQSVENNRLSMSGVALDEEMANMLRFQHAYQAASRVFNYIDSMIDKLINGTGRVGL
ncbi:MAG: flagellar basal body protein [Defluviitaleaceae bacterium]|nr:flagellar basal body protein [Defluviitaleaceae bacterium]MCL2836054.1 flagellar basal body protein [Defluviitaleaceae bacterium]